MQKTTTTKHFTNELKTEQSTKLACLVNFFKYAPHEQVFPRSKMSSALLPCSHAADVQLGLHVDQEQWAQGVAQKLLPVCGICSPNLAIFSSGFSDRSA